MPTYEFLCGVTVKRPFDPNCFTLQVMWLFQVNNDPDWESDISDIADNVQNNGEFTIVPSQYRNRDNTFLTDMKFGFIQINLTDSIPVQSDFSGTSTTTSTNTVTITPVVWSR